MAFDTTGLTEVKMQKANNSDWRGRYFLNGEGVCILKTCSDCRELLPAERFGPGQRKGLQSKCKECAINSDRARYYKIDPETGEYVGAQRIRGARRVNAARTATELRLAVQTAHPHGVKRCGKCRLPLRVEDFNRCASNTDGLYDRCRDCQAESWAVWSTKPYRAYWDSHGIPYECYITGEVTQLHSDHVIPEALEGPDDAYNRLPLRGDLNCSKKDTPLLQWLLERKDLAEYGPRGLVLLKVLGYGVWPFLESPEYVSEHWDEWSENADNIYDEWLADRSPN